VNDCFQLAVKKQMALQEKKNKMAAIVSDWQTSGLGQVEYAGILGLKLPTFCYYWVSKHKQTGSQRPDFIQIAGQVAESIHIRDPHGVELVLPAQTPAGFLRTLFNL
jgi:hypothetical protein